MKTILLSILYCVFVAVNISAQTTAFTYQGSLRDGASPANGNYDFQFWLYDAVTGGTILGSGIGKPNVAVVNGIFSVTLDFGSQFSGADRFLEIRVRQAGQPTYTFLAPRQPVNSAPYSVTSLNANPLPGSSNYIQNTTGTPQVANFNLTGSGLMSGSLGLGTLSPQTKLEVFTPTSNYGFSHTDGTTRMSTFVGPGSFGTAGGWLGTVSNHPMFFFSNNVGPQMTLATNGSVGIGTTTPGPKLEVQNGAGNAIFGSSSAANGVGVYGSSFSGTGVVGETSSGLAGLFNGPMTTTGNVGIGLNGGIAPDRLTIRTATSNYGLVHTDGTVSVGSFVGGSTGGGWYGTKSNHSLSFFTNNNPASMTIGTDGVVSVFFMAPGGGSPLCRNGFAIAFCSSSLRYKTNIAQFSEGMSFVNKLRPISFDWKKDGEKDIGFGAEDIEKIDSRFVTYNYEGQVEGVKYDRLSVAFVNALKEQQEQIETLQKTNVQQQQQIEKQQAFIESLEKRLEQLEKKDRP